MALMRIGGAILAEMELFRSRNPQALSSSATAEKSRKCSFATLVSGGFARMNAMVAEVAF